MQGSKVVNPFWTLESKIELLYARRNIRHLVVQAVVDELLLREVPLPVREHVEVGHGGADEGAVQVRVGGGHGLCGNAQAEGGKWLFEYFLKKKMFFASFARLRICPTMSSRSSTLTAPTPLKSLTLKIHLRKKVSFVKNWIP